MKILVHTNQILYPTDTGGKIRSARLLEQLGRMHDITIACFKRPHESEDQVARMRAICTRLELIEKAETTKRGPAFYRDLLRNLFSRHPYVAAKYHDPRMAALIGELLGQEEYDLLLCDPLSPVLNVIGAKAPARMVFEHNVEAQLLARQAKKAKGLPARVYLGLQHKKLSALEARVAREFDHLIMVSKLDCATMQRLYGVTNTSPIPMGVDVDYFAPGMADERPGDLVFTGSMDWGPNLDAMEFFVGQVMPLIRKQAKVTLWIVGRNPAPAMRELAADNPDVKLTGTVEDVRPYIARAQVYLAPLRVGGGTRLKIFEAMAMQKAVVSTTLGAEGLPVHHNEDIILADDAAGFAAAVAGLLRDHEARQRLASRAREMVAASYTWRAAAGCFSDICEKVLAQKRSKA